MGSAADGIVERYRRSPQHPEPARALHRVDAALHAADADAARRRLDPRLLEAGDVQGLGQAREVGQPRREADEVHVVGGARVERRDLLGGEPEPRGGGRQLEAELALVAARQLDGPRRGQDVRARPHGQRGQSRRELGIPDRERIVVHEERAVARHRLDDARDPVGSNQIVEGEHAQRHVASDLVGQLHGQRPVPAREKPRLGIDRHAVLPGMTTVTAAGTRRGTGRAPPRRPPRAAPGTARRPARAGTGRPRSRAPLPSGRRGR